MLAPLFLLSACASAGVNISDEPGALVWADEFDGDALDATSWSHDTFRNRDGWFNEEAQYYGPDAVEVSDGTLKITASKADLSDKPDWGGQAYGSARLVTQGKVPVRYGRVEARIRVPCGRGLWPAFWMLSEDDQPWPARGEIDIMEFVGHQPDRFHATIHTKDHNHMDGTERGAQLRLPDACDAWHVHRLDWGEDQLTVSVDGEPYFTHRKNGSGAGQWPFDKPFHILLNVAVGGTWGGREGIDEGALPATMEVDWVRVYAPG